MTSFFCEKTKSQSISFQTILPLWPFILKLLSKDWTLVNPCSDENNYTSIICSEERYFPLGCWVRHCWFLKIQAISSTLRWCKFSFLMIVDSRYVFHTDNDDDVLSHEIDQHICVLKFLKEELRVPWSPITRKGGM